jgi:hypothetical protein
VPDPAIGSLFFRRFWGSASAMRGRVLEGVSVEDMMTATHVKGSAAVIFGLALAACSAATTPPEGTGRSSVFTPPTTAGTTGTGAPAAPSGPGASDGGLIADNPGAPIITATGGMSGSGAAGTGLADGQCANQRITTRRVTPTVWLLIDGSGSMVTMLGDKSRWVALREALMDPTMGVVKSLETQVKFGMIMFDGPLPMGTPVLLPDGGQAMFSSGPATTCPRLVDVEPKLMNFADIDKAYTPDPLGGSTPTDKAVDSVVMHLPTAMQTGPDQMPPDPTYVVLATDGAPNDYCDMTALFAPMVDVRPKVIAGVMQLAAAGNKTYVISLAGDDQMLTAHLTDVAKAGGTGQPPYVPANKDDLVKAFQAIIGPEAACDVKLNGNVKMGSECKGSLKINGMALTCNDPNGWKLKDTSTISITGTACDTYKADNKALLEADFPCDVFALM